MTRKLHNTLIAVLTSSSLLVVGLIAGAPVASDPHATNVIDELVTIAAEPDLLTGMLPGIAEKPPALPPGQSRATRRSRQALAMPFYSFAPRG